jgi:hypothetical protein
MTISEDLFNSIKKDLGGGGVDYQIAEEQDMELRDVKAIDKCDSWKVFCYKFPSLAEMDKDKKDLAIQKNHDAILLPQSEMYKALVAKKYEENESMKESRGWLMEQIAFLRKSIAFLEKRKRELEDGIAGLEKNIVLGVAMMQELEDSDNFQKMSKKTEQKNSDARNN